MNQKKCPQCGEMNPPEAVMCWACYTPLPNTADSADAAAAPANRSAGKSAAETTPKFTDADENKKNPPAWQLAMVGVGLISLLAIGAQSFGFSPFGGGNDLADPPPFNDGGVAPVPFDPGPAPAPAPVGPVPPPPPPPNNQAPPPSPVSQFSVIALPNPNARVGVMAITPTQRTLPPARAASLAAFAHQQVINPARWSEFQVYVFNNDKAAEIFKNHQIRKRGAPLTTQDYRALANIWPNAIVVYEYRRSGNQGGGTVRYPYQNASGWWNERPRSAGSR